MSRKGSRSSRGSSATPEAPEVPENHETLDPRHASDAGADEEGAETQTALATEEPAQVELKIKGSDKSARAAAKRFGEGAAAKPPAVMTPGNDIEEPVDPTASLLSDGKNMVIVTRQKPRTIKAPDGSDFATNSRIPGRYTCPTSKAEIEELVFSQHGGSKYKCTIHPDTTDGENKILGHFTIEHPDPKCPPYIDGVTINLPEPEPETESIITRGDPTIRETDPLAQMRASLQRRLERAQMKKEIEELEAQIQDLEGKGKSGVNQNQPSAESEEMRKLREQNAQLQAQLAEKKVNDRFDRLETMVANLASKPAEKSGEDPTLKFMIEKMKSDDTRFTEMMKALTERQKAPVAATGEGDLDKFLDRVTKLQAITGSGPSKGGGRLSDLESKLIDMSFERLTNPGGSDEDEVGEDAEDVMKLAVKQFAPILKTFVEKKMDQESTATNGAPISKERLQQIYTEAATAAAKKVQEDLLSQGLHLVQDPSGKLVALPASKSGVKPTVPPRQAASRIVSQTKTAEGVVKKVLVEPADLSKKSSPPGNAAPAEVSEPPKGGEDVKSGVFPMLGPNNSELKIPFPVRPGDMKYDRKYSVNFVLDGIRSEIRQSLPQRAQHDQKIESYVIGDAIEFLDEEILDQLDGVDSGAKLESLLSPWGDAEKILEIKKAGEDEVVGSYLRKLVLSIQREWQSEKAR